MTMPSMSASALDRYRMSLGHVVPLSPETERELALAWRAGDSNAGRQLVEASLPFVIRIAREYRRWGVPLEDLIQQGNMGLLKAAQKYDPDKGCRLITYAVYWIRAEIRDYVVRTYRIVRLGTTRTERRAMRSYRRAGVENAGDLAESSGMPAARAEKLLPLLTQSDLSLDASIDDRAPAIERMRTADDSPEDTYARQERLDGVRRALGVMMGRLNDRERRIVDARMLSDEPRTLEQLGVEMGVSKERVRQIEEATRNKLRVALEAYAPAA